MKFSRQVIVSTALAAVTTQASAFVLPRTDTTNYTSSACNNSPDLCNKTYDSITYLGAHDSAFVRDASTSFTVSGNQYFNATIALDAGVRLLQTQVQELNKGSGVPYLCHTNCDFLNAGTLEDWLGKIKYWLDTHESEVVTLLIANVPNLPASSFTGPFERSGLVSYAYTPSSGGWPTLQTMIDQKKRLVVFLSGHADGSAAPYLLDEFSYIFETSFEVTSPSEFNCALDRPSRTTLQTALQSARLPLMNHFLESDLGLGILAPNVSYITTTNSGNDTASVGSFAGTVEKCTGEYGKAPSFVLVDFFDQGSPITAVGRINNVVNPVNRIIPPPAITSASQQDTVAERVAIALNGLVYMQSQGKPVKTTDWIQGGGSWLGFTGGSRIAGV